MPDSRQDAGAEDAEQLAAAGGAGAADSASLNDAARAEAEPPRPDPVLAASVELARLALEEITTAESIGRQVSVRAEADHVASILFECLLPGYPDWLWTVTLARVGEEAPTVLEAELLPGEGSLLAPDWVPWSERLADYEAAKTVGEDEDDPDAADDDEELDGDLDDDDLDDDDEDEDEDDDHDDVFEVDRQLDQFLDELAGADADDDEEGEPEGEAGEQGEDEV